MEITITEDEGFLKIVGIENDGGYKRYRCDQITVYPGSGTLVFIRVNNRETHQAPAGSFLSPSGSQTDIVDAIHFLILRGVGNLASGGSDGGIGTDIASNTKVSQPTTWGDYKFQNGIETGFWDSRGTGTVTLEEGGVTMSVAAGEYIVRKTFQSHPYLSGKPQNVESTVVNFAPQAGVIKRIYYGSSSAVAPFNTDYDGFFIVSDGDADEVRIEIYNKDVQATPIHSKPQDKWGNTLEGTDWDNFTIFNFDFLWLGGAGARYFKGLDNNPFLEIAHEGLFPYLISSRPDFPLGYSIHSTTGAGSMKQICTEISSLGPISPTGNPFGMLRANSDIDANATNVYYAICGIRLKTGCPNASVVVKAFSIISTINDELHVEIRINPTIASREELEQADGTAVGVGDNWDQGESGSCVEYAFGETDAVSSRTQVTGGRIVYSSTMASNSTVNNPFSNEIRLGSALDGAAQEFWLIVRPITTNADVYGTFTWDEY